jgi:hypothetical protein
LAADPGVRFGMTSFLGLMLDICMMQPSRVLVVAVVRVMHTEERGEREKRKESREKREESIE